VGESVHLYLRQRDKRICVAAVDGTYELRHFTEVGRPLPLSVGASGKLLLAFADPTTQAAELRRIARAPGSPRAPSAPDLTTQLEEIRASEWAMSFGEREEGLAAAAVPIRDRAGSVHAALSISGPTARLTHERLEGLRGQLSAAAREISLSQGWTGATADATLVGSSGGGVLSRA
jgi:DNA-binding IclR family transcriptional regulator